MHIMNSTALTYSEIKLHTVCVDKIFVMTSNTAMVLVNFVIRVLCIRTRKHIRTLQLAISSDYKNITCFEMPSRCRLKLN